ncbi:S41 family peptidase [Roseisolibacter sp. H3M3-2]|uniref:S41 family peptidase n=1 Tax=Roseisolibacter sp. H3M3-2 TaxID=3031323 RepID=UPI0023DC13F8|nr:S41 family peptidase [Roseisolibacter sp. H3M3-2]MDF1505232.1 PDZ domain-containing protein [Roseisolibacter sp. H3M3-2]
MVPISRRAALAAALTVAVPLGAQAPAGTRLLRTPSVSARHIAFTYANNVWVVERAGGSARRLTSFQGETTNPKLSPDGRTVAFSAEYGGNTDVYVVPVEGGQPTRLTWHAGADQVQGWTPDGKAVVFASGRASEAPSAAPRFWTVPVGGGAETPMAMPRAYQGKISPDGRHVAYRLNNSWDEERRNYRGGQNRPVWIMDLRSHEVVTPPWTDSKDVDPAWVGGTVYFISDRDGVANVWSYDPASKALTQRTRFTDFDVKALDANAGAVVFEQGGYVHELDPATGRSKQVAITAAGDFPWMMAQWKDVGNRMTDLALSPTGRRAAVEARGEIFTIPAEKGDVRNLTNRSASAEIAPVWSPDGRSVAYFSDRSGEYRLYIAPQEGIGQPREITLPEPSRPYAPAWSPDGRRIAFQDSHLRLWVVDVASGNAKVADTDPYFSGSRSIVPVWSPDSRWVAYPKRLPSLMRAIFLYDAQGGQVRQITDGLADATQPAWDASGKYLWFMASTNLGMNSGLLDMSAYERATTRGLYLTVLAKGEPSPLLPESDEEAARAGRAPAQPGREAPGQPDSTARPSAERRAPGDSTARAAAVGPRSTTVRIDFDGLAQRTIAVGDVALRDYAQLRAGAPGSVFFVELLPQTGTGNAAGGGQFGGGTLHRYQLSTRRAAPFAPGVAQFVVSADGKKLLYRTPGQQGALFLVDADKAAPTAGQGRLTAPLRAYVDPKAEFQQIFAEGWRNQRNNFYVKNLHGTDWPAVRKMYEPLLPSVMHRADLNYLLDNMGAETAIGHSYVRGGDMPEVPNNVAGLLGADFAVENGRYRIARVYDAESWNPELRAPLATPGVEVGRGDYLLAVNGVELRGDDNLYRLLDGTANRQTVLTVNARPTMEGARQVTVLPVANEQGLRTRAWVEGRRRMVDSLSKGKLAYVYVPNTGQPGYTSFNRYYFAQQDKDGAIIDERYNGGGSAADYIVDVLGRDFDGYFNNPVGDRVPYTSPAAGIWGPKVMIINEMAGSGGDLLPFMFKRRKIGPVVGKRTWGGLVATTDTPPFVDGGSMIAPRFGFIDRQGKFAVENEGVAPDIDVENWPKEVIAGRDPQLERAVQEALKLLAEKPIDRMKTEPQAPTWGKRQGNP